MGSQQDTYRDFVQQSSSDNTINDVKNVVLQQAQYILPHACESIDLPTIAAGGCGKVEIWILTEVLVELLPHCLHIVAHRDPTVYVAQLCVYEREKENGAYVRRYRYGCMYLYMCVLCERAHVMRLRTYLETEA